MFQRFIAALAAIAAAVAPWRARGDAVSLLQQQVSVSNDAHPIVLDMTAPGMVEPAVGPISLHAAALPKTRVVPVTFGKESSAGQGRADDDDDAGEEVKALYPLHGSGDAIMNQRHLGQMAGRERWIGWKHLSSGHGRLTETITPGHHISADDVGVNFFKAAPAREWIILAVVCVVLCVVDALVFRNFPSTFKWHVAIICIWICIAGLYLWSVWARLGKHKGVEWISGYVLEWMLSMDNLFVFHLVFQTYKTPAHQVHKAVFLGIIGAVVMRMVFFMVVSTLLHAFGWFRWPFGCLLVWSGIEAVREEGDDDMDVKDTRLVRGLRWLLGSRIRDGYDPVGTAIFLRDPKTGKLQLSVLLVVILVIEFSDVIFALDSVSAKVAQIPNQFVAFSSSVMAMYGLRAMFFVVEDLVEMFDLLKYGLGVILVFIGVELMFGKWIHVTSGLECILIVAVFVVCIIASHIKNRFWPAEEEGSEKDGDEKDDDNAKKETAEEASGGKEAAAPKAPAGPLDEPQEAQKSALDDDDSKAGQLRARSEAAAHGGEA